MTSLLLIPLEATVTTRLNIETVEGESRLTLVLNGELDLSTAPLLNDELARAKATGTAAITVDLDHLEFMDSSGLHVLIKHTHLASEGQRVRLSRGSAQVQRLFELSGVLDRLPFEARD